MARRLLLLLAVAAASLLVADARPCRTFLVSFPADPSLRGDGDGAAHHRLVPRVATVVTVFRVRRLGPHHPHYHRHHHHLHSIPANVQIRRPELPHPAAAVDAAAAGAQERARDILVVVVGLLFGVACGALTAASVYLVWSVVAGAAASSNYDELFGDEEEEEASDTESPKKVGYVIIQELEAHDGGKN
ncbi:hypothetical protein ACP70R_021404 [Stipagrostis hirtigluma subsp. patula]